MENSYYKTQVMGLMSVPPERRIEEVEGLLVMLKWHAETEGKTILEKLAAFDASING